MIIAGIIHLLFASVFIVAFKWATSRIDGIELDLIGTVSGTIIVVMCSVASLVRPSGNLKEPTI
jgi:hypothetical protein